MTTKNYNCDGEHCVSGNGEVRVYPIGSGGNLILCNACFRHENVFNFRRARETGHPEWFPVVNWDDAEVYHNA